jgi:uncharacterized membrane protein
MSSEATARPSARIPAIDLARTVALGGMIVFHFSRDLEMFGLAPIGMTMEPGWALFARIVAGSFIFLAGVSLVLAHGDGIRWRPYLRRLAMIAAAAAVITLATWLTFPTTFIFFGILHSIVVASVIGLAFLRAPIWLIAAAAVVFLYLPGLFRSEVFDPLWLAWIGLAARTPPSLDFVPVFPWAGMFLLGMAAAKGMTAMGLWERLRPATPPGRALRAATWPGRHSLLVYLVHQPVLIAGLAAWTWLTGP